MILIAACLRCDSQTVQPAPLRRLSWEVMRLCWGFCFLGRRSAAWCWKPRKGVFYIGNKWPSLEPVRWSLVMASMGRWPWISIYTWIRWNGKWRRHLMQCRVYEFKGRSTSPGGREGSHVSIPVLRDVQRCWEPVTKLPGGGQARCCC